MYQKIKGPSGLVLILDSSQVFPHDPGNGTPAMVVLVKGGQEIASSTYTCALNEGELLYHRGYNTYQLSDEELDWLDSMDPKVNAMYDAAGA